MNEPDEQLDTHLKTSEKSDLEKLNSTLIFIAESPAGIRRKLVFLRRILDRFANGDIVFKKQINK